MRRHDSRGPARHTLRRSLGAAHALVALLLLGAVVVLGTAGRVEPRATGPWSSVPGVPAPQAASARQQPVALVPTDHPPAPRSTSEAWLVPTTASAAPPAALRNFARGVKAYDEGNFAQALLLVSDSRLETTPLSAYSAYYTALCYLRLSRPAEARAVLTALRARPLEGYLTEAVRLAEAEAAQAAGDAGAAMRILEEASQRKTGAPDLVLDRLATAAGAAGDAARADAALLRLHYEHPLSQYASGKESEVERIRAAAGPARANEFAAADVRRAERLFTARRYAEARAGFERARPDVTGDQVELVNLRIAECDHFLGRNREALERLQPYLARASRRAEARYFELSALRALGRTDEYVARVGQLASEHADTTWAPDALNGLANSYVRANDDAAADAVFRRIVEEFPTSRHADRAAWKHGWWRYKNGDHAGAASVFEAAAARSPRSDFRPAWLYWAGRSRDRLEDRSAANARFELVTVDYLNSYYGRLAAAILQARGLEPGRLSTSAMAAVAFARTYEGAADGGAAAEPVASQAREASALPPTSDLIRALIAVELYPLALDELRFAQRSGGASAQIEATVAWVVARQGDLRRGINTMKQAYPQFLAAGGEQLPSPVLEVIFPLAYWDLIRRYSVARGLDPYLVAALVAQESTFDASARSVANARGLMQILPSTGRQLARAEGIRRFRTSQLQDPATNVRLGTRYFAELVRRFGGAHYALAGYNAGEQRVLRWRLERPGLDRDEFIDDIPFPETQNYVKRILGTAEDYRRLYSASHAASAAKAGHGRTAATTGKAKPAPSKKKSTTGKR